MGKFQCFSRADICLGKIPKTGGFQGVSGRALQVRVGFGLWALGFGGIFLGVLVARAAPAAVG